MQFKHDWKLWTLGKVASLLRMQSEIIWPDEGPVIVVAHDDRGIEGAMRMVEDHLSNKWGL